MITISPWPTLILYISLLLVSIKPLGLYIARIYEGKNTFLSPFLSPLENRMYTVCGINKDKSMPWSEYTIALLSFSFSGFILLFSLLLFQSQLPLNPRAFPSLSADLAFNTAASFITNTDWQSYSGEQTLSYFSQMVGLTVQNFLSATVGLAVLMALIRGFAWKNTCGIGNFWTDIVRGSLYIFLPLSLVLALLLGSQGVIQTLGDYVRVPVLETLSQDETENSSRTQTLARGPVASQVAIKQLGTNGGGFFSANSAHPFENPTSLSNFFEMLAILLIPSALCYTFGTMVDDKRQGWALLIVMAIIFIPFFFFGVHQEFSVTSDLATLNVDPSPSSIQPGGHMEGKEMRFGIVNSVFWSALTAASSNGSVSAMYDSFTPLGGMVPLILMMFTEIIFGGVGSGLYSLLIFVIITVFIAGLMVGRTPEFLGKKIQAFEMKMACIALLIPTFLILVGTALAVCTHSGRNAIQNPGAQGFTEILYALTSTANNNGSSFAGLSSNTPFYNTLLGFCMLFGRYWVIIPVLAIAGSLAGKNTVPPSAGTLPTHTPLFMLFLISTILLVSVLTYAPALALGPIAQYLNTLPSPKG
jgi:K+-transporting ATPase ATPase A chain